MTRARHLRRLLPGLSRRRTRRRRQHSPPAQHRRSHLPRRLQDHDRRRQGQHARLPPHRRRIHERPLAYLGGNAGASGGRGARRNAGGGRHPAEAAAMPPSTMARTMATVGGAVRSSPPAASHHRTRRPRRFGAAQRPPRLSAGVPRPKNNYTTGYGLEYPNLLSPPWSTITCYDLNTGTIKWQRPLGEDPPCSPAESTTPEFPMARRQRYDRHLHRTALRHLQGRPSLRIRCRNRKTALEHPTPPQSRRIPAMYEAGGRQFLIVCSMADVIGGSGRSPLQPGYIAYALPQNKVTQNGADHADAERTAP